MSEFKITGIPGGSDGQRRVVRVNVVQQSKPTEENLPSPAPSREPVQLEETGLMPQIEDNEAPEAGNSSELKQEQVNRDKARRDQQAQDRQQAAHDAWLFGRGPKPGPLSNYYDESDPEYERPVNLRLDESVKADVQSDEANDSFLESQFGGNGNDGRGDRPAGRGPEGGNRKRRAAVRLGAAVLVVAAVGAGGKWLVDTVTAPGPNHKVIESDGNIVKPAAPSPSVKVSQHPKKTHAKATKQSEAATPSPTPAQPTETAPAPQPTTPPKPTKAELAVAAMPLGQKIDQLVDVRVPELVQTLSAPSTSTKNGTEASSPSSTEPTLETYQDNGNLIFSGLPSQDQQKQIADLKKNSVYSPEITFAFDQDGQLPSAFTPDAKPVDIAKELQAIKEAGADRIVLPVNLDLPRAVGDKTNFTKQDLLSVNDLAGRIKMLAAMAKKHGLRLSLNSFPTEEYSSDSQSDVVPLAQNKDSLASEIAKRSRLVVNQLKDSEIGVFINANAEVPKGIKLYSDNRSPALNSFAANVLHGEGYQQTPAVGLAEYALAHPKNAAGQKETLADYVVQALHVGATSIVLEQPTQSEPTSTNQDVQPVSLSQQADQLRADIKAAVKSGEISQADLNDAVLANLQGPDGGVLRVIRHIKKQAAAEAKAAKAEADAAKTSEQPSSSPTATATPSAKATSPTKTSQTKSSSKPKTTKN